MMFLYKNVKKVPKNNPYLNHFSTLCFYLKFFCLICLICLITFVIIAVINAFHKDLTAIAICKSPLPYSALAMLHFL